MSQRIILRAAEVQKSFGATRALRGVTFDARAGEVHALCGENGAGKSTLVGVLGGLHAWKSYEGEVWIDGRLARWTGVRDAEAAGVVVVHQELALIDSLSIAENLFLHGYPASRVRVHWAELERQGRDALRRVGLGLSPDEAVGSLGAGQKQLVEVARGLVKRPKVLILDEPTASLTERDAAHLFEILRGLRREGVAIVYISHRLAEVLSLADRVSVLRDGSTVATDDAANLDEPAIVRHMVGRQLAAARPRQPPANAAAPALRVRDLTAYGAGGGRAVRDVSFDVRPGEVVGVAGLMGAGRSELLMHLYGLWGKRVAGSVHVGGRDYPAPTPIRSVERGVVLITEDRRGLGLALDESSGRNLSLSSLGSIADRFGVVDRAVERRRNESVCDAVCLSRGALPRPVRQLSGGNQQKVVLGRALLTDPRLILLDEPFRGVDIAAKRQIMELVSDLATRGKAILLVSSELGELFQICNRLMVLAAGRVAASFDAPPFSLDEVLLAATRATHAPAGAGGGGA
ncbi:sugar ABC transporter ATP-binding protein [Botrimarina sp.]|uniref:sugar ABC transporter ATP-binding protein n=1 Tax=Botrimarina sp. TaxID=2795802 RepID=UPI0032EADDD5